MRITRRVFSYQARYQARFFLIRRISFLLGGFLSYQAGYQAGYQARYQARYQAGFFLPGGYQAGFLLLGGLPGGLEAGFLLLSGFILYQAGFLYYPFSSRCLPSLSFLIVILPLPYVLK